MKYDTTNQMNTSNASDSEFIGPIKKGQPLFAFARALSAATPEAIAHMRDLLGATDEIRALRNEIIALKGAAAAAPAPVPKKKTVAPAKKPVAITALAESTDAPTAADYRLRPEDIDATRCVARIFDKPDKRWKPAVYYETQCDKMPVAGHDLCARCIKRLEKYCDAADEPAKAQRTSWTGTLHEEPLDWMHMLGTAWADEKKPVWLGSEASSETASVASAKPKPKPKSRSLAQQWRDACKGADKPAVGGAGAAPATVPAKADHSAVVEDADGSLEVIDGNIYMIRKGKAYEYNQVTNDTSDMPVGLAICDDDENWRIEPLPEGAAESDGDESD